MNSSRFRKRVKRLSNKHNLQTTKMRQLARKKVKCSRWWIPQKRKLKRSYRRITTIHSRSRQEIRCHIRKQQMSSCQSWTTVKRAHSHQLGRLPRTSRDSKGRLASSLDRLRIIWLGIKSRPLGHKVSGANKLAWMVGLKQLVMCHLDADFRTEKNCLKNKWNFMASMQFLP